MSIEQEWVSVDERVPVCGMYNVCYFNPSSTTTKLYVITVWRGRNGWYNDNSEKENAEDSTLRITYWMNLPKPPKNY